MKFGIERDELLKALSAIQGVVEKRNTMPILSNILLEAQEGANLRVTATDLEVGLTSVFESEIGEPGQVTLNAKNLMDITRQLPSQKINFNILENCDVEISCGKTFFKLHGLPAEDFPSLPEVEAKSAFTFPASDLTQMIDRTIFSVSTDETRYNLSGVYLEVLDKNILRMVSSDGHRLSVVDHNVPSGELSLPENIIIPRKGLLEIRKICSDSEEEIKISFAKSNCVVEQGDTRLVIRLIDGEFPDYRQVLPNEDKQKKVTLDRESFLSALKRISILSQEKTRGVRFQFDKNLLKIAVNNPDLGEAEEEMEIQFKEDALEIGFNARYFMDVLTIIDTDQVDLFLTDGLSQGLVSPKDDSSFKAVIMPMKLL